MRRNWTNQEKNPFQGLSAHNTHAGRKIREKDADKEKSRAHTAGSCVSAFAGLSRSRLLSARCRSYSRPIDHPREPKRTSPSVVAIFTVNSRNTSYEGALECALRERERERESFRIRRCALVCNDRVQVIPSSQEESSVRREK